MSRELIINGKRIELSDQTKIGVTYQANNIGELQNRQGTYTNTFQVPTTPNAEALELVHLMSSATQIPYRRLLATYIEDGIEIVSDGFATIAAANKRFVSINVTSGNVDLAKSMGAKTVGEYYENDQPFTWGINEAINSRDGSEYYIFPFVDWRADIDTFFTTPQVDVRQMLPAATMPGLFDRISADTGYTFIGDYINSAEHKNMILTPSEFSKNPEFISLDQKTSEIIIGNAFAGQVFAPEDSNVISSSSVLNWNSFEFPFNGQFYYPQTNEVGSFNLKGFFTLIYQFSSNGWFLINNDIQYFTYTVRIKDTIGGVHAEFLSQVFEDDVLDLQNQASYQPAPAFNITTPDITLLAGLGYYVELTLNLHGRSKVDTSVLAVLEPGSKFVFTPSLSLTYGNDIYFRDIFRMKAVDVLKDVLNLRGIIIQTNNYTKEVQFNLFQDLVSNLSIAEDWSDKIDVRETAMGFQFGKYAQKNWCRFKPDDDVTEELGDSYFLVDDENLESDKDVIKINHSATEQGSRYIGYNIPAINAVDALNNWQKPTYRILMLERQSTNFNVNYTDGTTNSNQNTNIPFARFVGFEILIPDFYGALVGILDQTKALRLATKLTPIDIQTLNFAIPKTLSVPQLDIDGDFYLNLIDTYKRGVVFCEFVRL